MINFKDEELTDEEIKEVKIGIISGKVDETLDLMGSEELKELKDKIVDKELTFDKKNNDKTDKQVNKVDEYLKNNKDIFSK